MVWDVPITATLPVPIAEYEFAKPKLYSASIKFSAAVRFCGVIPRDFAVSTQFSFSELVGFLIPIALKNASLMSSFRVSSVYWE